MGDASRGSLRSWELRGDDFSLPYLRPSRFACVAFIWNSCASASCSNKAVEKRASGQVCNVLGLKVVDPRVGAFG